MFNILKYGDLCWWCDSNKATTAEHKYKKSDFKELFNKVDDDTIIINKTINKNIQGPDSNLIKFDKNLCANCNNNRSQAMDKAYSFFIKFILKNHESIIQTQSINFKEIFGVKWESNKRNVHRYLLKHVCCRLHKNKISIPSSFIEFLDGGEILDHIAFRFCFNELQLNAYRKGHSYLGVDPLQTDVNDDMTINYIASSYNIGAFKIHYLCSQGFHKGQHYDFEEHQKSPLLILYKSNEEINPFEDMTSPTYFQREYEKIKKTITSSSK